mgnify:CR=1 FL=1
MKLYAVISTIPGCDRERCREFHYTVFHGFVSSNERIESAQYPSLVGAINAKPLHLTRTGVEVPKIFGSSRNLFIDQPTYEQMKKFPGVEFLDVKFDKLVNFTCRPGDMSYLRNRRFNIRLEDATERFLAGLPDVPELHSTIGARYELVCKSAEVLLRERAEYSPTTPLRVSVESDDLAKISCDIDLRLFDKFPILCVGRGIIMVPEIFDILGPQLDPEFYFTSMIEI